MAVIAVVATVATAYLLLPIAAWGFVRLLTSTLNGCIWLAASLSSGNDVWTIAGTVGRAAAATLVTPLASGVIAALIGIGAVAVFGLQRLLGSGEDSSR